MRGRRRAQAAASFVARLIADASLAARQVAGSFPARRTEGMSLAAPRIASASLAAAFVLASTVTPVLAGGSTAEVDAYARAAGNRRADAVRIGERLFTRVLPAQVLKVRVDGAGAHEVAGLVISGVKFHGPLSRAGFTDEVSGLVRDAFAASRVEEVDCWVTVPLPVGAHVVVTGDMAAPTSRIVFSITVRRAEGARFVDRLRRGTDVFWDPAFERSLVAQGGSGTRGQS